MRPLLLNSTFWALLGALVYALVLLAKGRSGRSVWEALGRLLADPRVAAILLLGAGLNLALREVAGYINPRDYIQDEIAARQLLRHRTLYPTDLPALGVAELAQPMAGGDILRRMPVIRNEFDMLSEPPAPLNAHPPVVGLLLALPVAALGTRGSFLLISAVSGVLLAVGLFAIVRRLFPGLGATAFLALLGLVFGWHAVLAGLRSGQPGLAIFFLVTFCWARLRERKYFSAGIAAGLAACLQLFPALIAAYLALRFRRAFLAAAGVVVVLFAAVAALSIPSTFSQWLATMGTVAKVWVPNRSNLSLAGFGSGLLDRLGWTLDPKILEAAGLALAGVILVFALRPWKRLVPSLERVDAEFSLVVGAMLLASPIAWSRYLPILLLPIAVLVRRWTRVPLPPALPSRQVAMPPSLFLLALVILAVPDLTVEWLYQRLAGIAGAPFGWLATSWITLVMVGILAALTKLLVLAEAAPAGADARS